ncbi:glutamate receptor 2.8-like [Dorcoceras hygrometricum]|uniref:Glutamate receptor 2.8-like n=1 Tax=Dorcoceras hygrometricum TaxID=472368 RepID=A0A2Z7CMV0_9LAMI|nr:glutamate receptor 2.8-like [Dorcoceras hygrometricum]
MIALDLSSTTHLSADHNVAPNQVSIDLQAQYLRFVDAAKKIESKIHFPVIGSEILAKEAASVLYITVFSDALKVMQMVSKQSWTDLSELPDEPPLQEFGARKPPKGWNIPNHEWSDSDDDCYCSSIDQEF